jgi:hypothetical protein
MKTIHSIKVCDEQPVKISDYPEDVGTFELLVMKGALDVEPDGTHLTWHFTRMSDGHPLTPPRRVKDMPALLLDFSGFVHIDDGQLILFATDPKQRELQRREEALGKAGIEIRATGTDEYPFYWWHKPSKTASSEFGNAENAILSAENFVGYLSRHTGEVAVAVQRKFVELMTCATVASPMFIEVAANQLDAAIQAVRRGES